MSDNNIDIISGDYKPHLFSDDVQSIDVREGLIREGCEIGNFSRLENFRAFVEGTEMGPVFERGLKEQLLEQAGRDMHEDYEVTDDEVFRLAFAVQSHQHAEVRDGTWEAYKAGGSLMSDEAFHKKYAPGLVTRAIETVFDFRGGITGAYFL